MSDIKGHFLRNWVTGRIWSLHSSAPKCPAVLQNVGQFYVFQFFLVQRNQGLQMKFIKGISEIKI